MRLYCFAVLAAKAAISGAGSPLLFRSWQPSGSPPLLLGCIRRNCPQAAPERSDETLMQRRARPGSSCSAGRGLRLRRPGHGKRRRIVLARIRRPMPLPLAPVAAHSVRLTGGINPHRQAEQHRIRASLQLSSQKKARFPPLPLRAHHPFTDPSTMPLTK